jgi:hypothetical protein
MSHEVSWNSKEQEKWLNPWTDDRLEPVPLPERIDDQEWSCAFPMIVQRRVGVHVMLKQVLTVPALTRHASKVKTPGGKQSVLGLVDPVVSEATQDCSVDPKDHALDE